ncbi:MAG TPA: type II secretion system protein GspD, partial [Chromatiales bacterium]|nr:type II secretion system protein GspD [Chromatiales bacterium]
RLEHASAAEIVRIVNALAQGARAGAQGAAAARPPTTVVADERTNSVLISGDKNERLRIRTLITHLDTPLETGGDTQVRYLRYADAEDLATKLQTQYAKQVAEQGGPAESGDITIWSDAATNALILTAPPKIMRSMMSVIDRLDIRRLQVLLETIIVEVSAERAADLGVTWAIADAQLENAVGLTSFSNVTGVAGLAGLINGGDPGDAAAAVKPGITLGLGRVADTGTSFVGLIEALEADTDTNVMGTPILVTLDNEEAEIKVGQEVPFVTGSFTNTGTAGSALNPFQTVERQQVGLTLKITPQINEGDAVRLKISQEVSSVSESTQAVDLITNNRNIDTAVIVENKGILVLGGLIQDELREKVERVPMLGSIPLVGALFRSTSRQKVKTNLMFFIRPTILRNDTQAAFETNAKYGYIRGLQMQREPDRVLPTWENKRPPPPVLPWSPTEEPVAPDATEDDMPTIDLRKLDTEPAPEE